MGLFNLKKVNQNNDNNANIKYAQGQIDGIVDFMFREDNPVDFLMSGSGCKRERYDLLYKYLFFSMGKMPIIIIHNSNILIEQMVYDIWSHNQYQIDDVPLWIVNNTYQQFEPFFAMDRIQIKSSLEAVALECGYSNIDSVDKVLFAHLDILDILKQPYSLSGLYYLCQFNNIEEFHNNVNELDADVNIKARIWADLNSFNNDGTSALETFRSLINNLVSDVRYSGWFPDNQVNIANIYNCIQRHAVMTINSNSMKSDKLIAYLASELEEVSASRFLLILDGYNINNDRFLQILSNPDRRYICGVITNNVVESLGKDTDSFERFIETVKSLIVFSHSSSTTAARLSEAIGKSDHMNVSANIGQNQSNMSILEKKYNNSVSYSIENKYRVMPEDITALMNGQAIIKLTDTDEIIYYNC